MINAFAAKPTINFLVLWVGQFCTLRCKNCCNLMPYTNQFHYDMDKTIDDLKKTAKNTQIIELQIQGGEPFAHPELYRLIPEAAALPIKTIEIATNGTVMLTSKAISALQKAKNITVRVSNYPLANIRKNKFIQQLKDNGITYSEYSFMYGDSSWFDSGAIDAVRNEDEDSVRTIYKDCQNKCWTLADGILSVCGKIVSLKELRNVYDKTPYNEISIRDISSSDELIYSITKFLANRSKHREACGYCLGTYKKVPSAIQATPAEIEERLSKLPVPMGGTV